MKKQKKKLPPPPAPPPKRSIKEGKEPPSPPLRKITDYKRLNDLNQFEAGNTERELKRREKEIQIVNIVGGFLGIGTLIIAGLIYGWALTAILFFAIIANNLCNLK